MIVVPEKTIAYIPVVPNEGVKPFSGNVSEFIKPLNTNHERDWFTPHFYKCLPLSIGNMQGFVFSIPFNFSVIWNGNNELDAITIFVDGKSMDYDPDSNGVYLSSEFGHGILTAHFPVMLKTPPGVNLMTIAPPNYPVPGISPMTGVVETDNLRFSFTLNFKIDLQNVLINVEKNYPIMGLLPIPRYYCDSFELVSAYDIFDKDDVEEERTIFKEHSLRREQQNKNNNNADLLYFKGMDIRKNKFKDHQLPGKKK